MRRSVHTVKQGATGMLIRSKDIEIAEKAKSHGLSTTQFVLDIKLAVIAMIDDKGVLNEKRNAKKGKLITQVCTMQQAEDQNFCKHEEI